MTEVGTTDEIVELTLAKRSSVCRLSRAIEGLWKSDDEMLSLKTCGKGVGAAASAIVGWGGMGRRRG